MNNKVNEICKIVKNTSETYVYSELEYMFLTKKYHLLILPYNYKTMFVWMCVCIITINTYRVIISLEVPDFQQ
jgi:hypothetical protein